MPERLAAAPSMRNRAILDNPLHRELRENPAQDPSNAEGPLGTSEQIGQLKYENRRLAIQVEALRSGAASVLHELDTKMLARAVARQAAHLLRAEYGLVELYDQDLPYFRTAYCREAVGFSAGSVEDLGLTPGSVNSLSRWVVLHRQSHLYDSAFPTYQVPGADLAEAGCRHALCVPLLNHQGYVVGILQARNASEGGLFSQQDLAVAEALAMQAAIGLERTRLFDRMQEWSQSMEILLAFNAAVNQHLNPSELVRRLVENAARFLKSDGGLAGLALPTEPSGTVCMSGEAYWNRGVWHDWPRTWRPLEGIPGHVLENEFPYLSNEYPDDRIADQELVAKFDVQRALCVPIKDVDECVLGFFELHKGANQPPFTWQDAAFVESLANTTAVAIRNAQLIKALEIKSQQIQALSAHNLLCLEDERKHIARELHDEAGQALIAIQLGLQVLSRQVPAELREDVSQLGLQVRHSTKLLGSLARHLRPPTLDRLGLHGALRQLALDYQERLQIQIVLNLSATCDRLPQPMELALYRIAQEALTNTAKYAQASRVDVTLMREGSEVFFSVRDDGKGFDHSAQHPGLGLMGIRERADMLSARLSIQSRPGRGTEIAVRALLA
jgi:signal transduction histidine kinase